jgi:hypothetical protein
MGDRMVNGVDGIRVTCDRTRNRHSLHITVRVVVVKKTVVVVRVGVIVVVVVVEVDAVVIDALFKSRVDQISFQLCYTFL